MNKIIQIDGLCKVYGEIKAVNGISFYVEEGQLFSFLGPNGAGKSTTIDMICTFLQPSGGSIVVNGHTVGVHDENIRREIGAVFQDGVLDKLLTVEENLKARGRLYGIKGNELKGAVSHVAEITGISNYLKRPYGKLSGGQRRRCDIARALIHTPKILFLDEPTTGLDPQTRKHIWETIGRIQKQNKMTVFLTTHYMEEAANSDYIVVIDDGEIIAKGTPTYIKETYSNDHLILTCKEIAPIKAILDHQNRKYTLMNQVMHIPIGSTMDALPLITAVQTNITSFEVVKGTMDDAFITITGKELRE